MSLTSDLSKINTKEQYTSQAGVRVTNDTQIRIPSSSKGNTSFKSTKKSKGSFTQPRPMSLPSKSSILQRGDKKYQKTPKQEAPLSSFLGGQSPLQANNLTTQLQMTQLLTGGLGQVPGFGQQPINDLIGQVSQAQQQQSLNQIALQQMMAQLSQPNQAQVTPQVATSPMDESKELSRSSWQANESSNEGFTGLLNGIRSPTSQTSQLGSLFGQQLPVQSTPDQLAFNQMLVSTMLNQKKDFSQVLQTLDQVNKKIDQIKVGSVHSEDHSRGSHSHENSNEPESRHNVHMKENTPSTNNGISVSSLNNETIDTLLENPRVLEKLLEKVKSKLNQPNYSDNEQSVKIRHLLQKVDECSERHKESTLQEQLNLIQQPNYFDENLYHLNARKTKKVTACPHTNRKHYAKNMCSACYHRKGRTKLAWKCDHKEKVHYARGLCQQCYLTHYAVNLTNGMRPDDSDNDSHHHSHSDEISMDKHEVPLINHISHNTEQTRPNSSDGQGQAQLRLDHATETEEDSSAHSGQETKAQVPKQE